MFSISQSSHRDSILQVTIDLNPTHGIFKSHFPGHPITPGVIQLKIVQELLEVHLKKTLVLEQVISAKFLNLIDPTTITSIDIFIQCKNENVNRFSVRAKGHRDQIIFFSFSMVYETK